MKTADVAAILIDAKALLAERPYQTRFFAALDTGEMEVWHDHGRTGTRPKLVMCSPQTPDAMLSFHGAIISAAGSGPRAWEVFDLIGSWGVNIRTREIATRQEALSLLDECIRRLRPRNGPVRARALVAATV